MSLTQDYTYRLGDDGVILNADDTTSTFVDITKINGLDSAPPRTTERDHEGTDGGFMDAEFEKGRSVTLEGTVYAVNSAMEPYLDELKANWALSRTLVPLYFKKPGVTERVLFVKPLGCRYDFDEAARLGQADIQFQAFAEDPRVYNSTLIVSNVSQGEKITTGRSYPKSYPYSYGATPIVVGTYVIVDGNRPTPPVFTFSGPLDNPQIINESTGESLIFDISLTIGDTMVVDTKTRTILVNGENRRSSLRSPNWFFLQPGNNYIRFRAQSTYTTPGTVQNANPYFETDVTNWSASGATLVRSTAQFHEGIASGLLTPDGVTPTVEVGAEKLPVVPLGIYWTQAWVYCAVSRNINIGFNWYTPGLVFMSQIVTPLAVSANTWTLLSFNATAPIGSGFGQMKLQMTGTPPAGNLLYMDEARFQQSVPSAMTVQYRSAWR